jgi:hypothetical protein
MEDEALLATKLESLVNDLPETISMEDVKRHEWLRRLVIVADDLANRVDYRALEWAKSQ